MGEYHGELKETLCAMAETTVSFAGREPKMAALFIALYHSARGNEAYRAVRPMVLELQRIVENVFDSAASNLGNMHGRQRQFSVGFIGLVIYYIVMKQEMSGGKGICISREEIESVVHQFMHGIYS